MNQSRAYGLAVLIAVWGLAMALPAHAQVAVRGKIVYTMSGPPIEDGIVMVEKGKISALGRADQIRVPEGYRTLEAAVVTPGLIDAHATVGLTGILNIPHDQDQLESTTPIQPELRAIDAYNPREDLIEWIRSFGITTVHTGHGPGELMSGQTMVVKTAGNNVEETLLVDTTAIASTLSTEAKKNSGSPGTRGKMMAMLRAELIKAQEYQAKQERAAAAKDENAAPPTRDLRLETLTRVLKRELPLLVTAHRAQDISNALRLAREFDIKLWLDGGAESYLLIDDLKGAGVPVILHPAMARAYDDQANQSFTTAAKLVEAGVPVALQSGYEAYVPKVRVVLFEAAIFAAHGLPKEKALAAITIDAARLLGVQDRVGSLEVGKDGDIALYDGDPFEYSTHCTGVIINGKIVSEIAR
ncbi:MAG: amidohydrolase family protein [Pirellulales bacterium]|nr:amidohydrolase family protein [Pirellulales bacterium]